MQPPHTIPPALRVRPFTSADAHALGLTDRMLRNSAYRRLYRDVYAAADLVLTTELRCLAALLSAGGHVAVTGWSALDLWNVARPVFSQDDGAAEVHLVRFRGSSRRGQPGVIVHTSRRPIPVIEHPGIEGLKYVDPALAWVSLAMAGASIYELVVAGDGLTRRHRPLASVERLSRRLADYGVFRGSANARIALRLVREGTDSPMETHVRLLVLAAGLPEPDVNRPVWDDDGTLVARLDLGYRRWRIDLEYDGIVHIAQWRRDRDRERALSVRGWRIVRCNGSILHSPDRFLTDLQLALKAEGWAGTPRPPQYSREFLGIPVVPATGTSRPSAGRSRPSAGRRGA